MIKKIFIAIAVIGLLICNVSIKDITAQYYNCYNFNNYNMLNSDYFTGWGLNNSNWIDWSSLNQGLNNLGWMEQVATDWRFSNNTSWGFDNTGWFYRGATDWGGWGLDTYIWGLDRSQEGTNQAHKEGTKVVGRVGHF